MRKKNWKKWAAMMVCCAVAWGTLPPSVQGMDSGATGNEQNREEFGDRIVDMLAWASDFYDQFCGFCKTEVQILATPLFEPYVVHHASGASRGDEDEASLLPQPMPGSMLLSDHRTRFAWNVKGHKMFTIKDANSGAVVFSKDVTNRKEIYLVPKEAGMQQGRTYLWELDGDARSIRREVRLLDTALEADLQKRLPELNTVETYGDIDRQMLQAAYLVALSDKSGGKIDLHWLAVEMMMKSEAKNLKDDTSAKLREVLLEACRVHLDQRLP